MQAFAQRLADPRPVLLDGATGTELTRRGVDTSLPLWTAAAILEAPDVLRQIHRDYVEAGAELITANTFRTHARSLKAAGWDQRAGELTERAVQLAREAAGQRAWVAGSLAPLEDCYSPERTPADDALAREHAEQATNLAAAGVDCILAETMPTVREAMAAARAAVATGLPTWVGFVCDSEGKLLSGESVAEAAEGVLPLGPAGLLINCTPTPEVHRALAALRKAAGDMPLGAYGNIGRPDPQQGWVTTDAADPEAYARYAETWLSSGARLIGGCCGTTPDHIAALRKLLDRPPAA